MTDMGVIVLEGAIAPAEVLRVEEVEEWLAAKGFCATVGGNINSNSFQVAPCLIIFRIPTGCLGDGLSTEFDQQSVSPTVDNLLVAVKRRSELRKLSAAHSTPQDKNKRPGGEAQLLKAPQRRAVPVSM